MTILFQPATPQDPDQHHPGEQECSCLSPDDQYLLEVDNGSVFLIHQACGKQPAGDYTDLIEMPRMPVTVTAHPYGNCDGSEWHGEYRCDCGIALVATVNGLSVLHDDKPYLLGRDYADSDGDLWHVTDTVDASGRPLVFLLPEGSGADIPLAEAVTDFGPLTLTPLSPEA
jgi:hypothetical protein